MSEIAERPARKQVQAPAGPARAFGAAAAEINIWTGKPLSGGKRKEPALPSRRAHICRPEHDAGRTRAVDAGGAFLCLHFARGECARGADCTYLHRVPNAADEERASLTHDIFGRDRHATERADMGGVGSFERANRSLFVNGLRADRQLETALRSAFQAWGAIHSITLLPLKGAAFVKYRLRAAAEFAKEAMHEQSLLDAGDVLNVRWATEDPNPHVRERAQAEREQQLTVALVERMRADLAARSQAAPCGAGARTNDFEEHSATTVEALPHNVPPPLPPPPPPQPFSALHRLAQQLAPPPGLRVAMPPPVPPPAASALSALGGYASESESDE